MQSTYWCWHPVCDCMRLRLPLPFCTYENTIKMKSFASLGHKEACKLLRLWHVTHHSHSSHSLFSEKPGSPPTLTYIPHWLCLIAPFLQSPVQKGQPWRSPYIGRSHMNLQIFLSLQDPAWSIQVVTYPFYDLVTFVIQFRQRACGHGIQDNCGLTIPKLLRWALPSQHATCLVDTSCAALRTQPCFLVSEFVSTGSIRAAPLCVWTLQTLAEVRIAIQSVAVAVLASRSVISRGLEAGGFWCVGFWCPKGRRAETCSCCSGLCHRLPCRGSANQHPTYLPIDLQQGSYYHTHTT